MGRVVDEVAARKRALRLALGDPPDGRIEGLCALLDSMGGPPPDRDSAVREIPARLGDRWSALLLMVLQTGTYGHAEIRRVIAALSAEKSISQRVLTLRLRALERDGFVVRTITPEVPPRVDYALTPLGEELTDRLVAFIRWIEDHDTQIEAARTAFEQSNSA